MLSTVVHSRPACLVLQSHSMAGSLPLMTSGMVLSERVIELELATLSDPLHIDALYTPARDVDQ